METFKEMSSRQIVERVRVIVDYTIREDCIIEEVNVKDFENDPWLKKKGNSGIILLTPRYGTLVSDPEKAGLYFKIRESYFRLFYKHSENKTGETLIHSYLRSYTDLVRLRLASQRVKKIVDGRYDAVNFYLDDIPEELIDISSHLLMKELLFNPVIKLSNLVRKTSLEEILSKELGMHLYLIEEEPFTDYEQIIFQAALLPSLYRKEPRLDRRRIGINGMWYEIKGKFEERKDELDDSDYEQLLEDLDDKLIQVLTMLRRKNNDYI